MTASERDIAAIRERTDVADVIARYVARSPAGADSLKGLCPFHAETTPSFHVRPSIGHFHCFGCGFGGDVYTFVQRIEGISFGAAVAKLRRRCDHVRPATPRKRGGIVPRISIGHALVGHRGGVVVPGVYGALLECEREACEQIDPRTLPGFKPGSTPLTVLQTGASLPRDARPVRGR